MTISEIPLKKHVELCVSSAEKRAKDRDTKARKQCTITLEEMEALWDNQNGLCAVSHQQMTRYKGHGTNHIVGTNGSIDRIDSTKGYTPDNVQWVCWCVNRMKGSMDERSFLGWCSTIVYHAIHDGTLRDNRLTVCLT